MDAEFLKRLKVALKQKKSSSKHKKTKIQKPKPKKTANVLPKSIPLKKKSNKKHKSKAKRTGPAAPIHAKPSPDDLVSDPSTKDTLQSQIQASMYVFFKFSHLLGFDF